MPTVTINESSVINGYIDAIVAELRSQGIANSGIPAALFGYRPLRPDDFSKFESVSGTAAYSWSVAAGTSTIISFTVPTSYALAFFGLEGAFNISSLLPGGYFSIIVNGTKKVQVNLADLANAQSGKIYFFDQYLIVTQQQHVEWEVNNPTTVSQTIGLWPACYIASTRKNLNID